MKKRKGIIATALAAAVLMVGGGQVHKAHALEVMDGKIGIFGYGDTSFNLTTKNKYLDADSSGGWRTQLALLFTGKVTDDVSVWTQIFGDQEHIRLDWAFVDYRFNDNLQLRGGQVKLPVGIYNEIRDIKYLQLSNVPPLVYREEAEMIDEAFQGASVIGSMDLGSHDLELNLFGGQGVSYEDEPSPHNQIFGGRLTYTPLPGMRLMVSGFTAKVKFEEENQPTETGRSNMVIGSFDYARHNVNFKAEYLYRDEIDERAYAYYVQGGYTLFEKLTPFVRYDYLTNDKADRGNPEHFQKEFTVGVGYKFNNNVAVKVEDHFIEGYALLDREARESARRSWNLFTASINYIF